MASTIKLKNGSGAPLASDLVQGEPALDLTNKRLYTEDAGGNVIEVGTNPSTITIPGGTIDGTTIGGTTPAAGTFTTFTSTGIDDNASSTAVTINSDGEVVIGGNTGVATYPAAALSIESDTSSYSELLLFRNDTDMATNNTIGRISFVGNDTTSNTPQTLAYIQANADSTHGAGSTPTRLVFATTPSGSETVTERMRIDSSGSVLFGTTSTSSAEDGVRIRGDALGLVTITRNGNRPLLINRRTTDGDILEFQKDGTTVGSIGTYFDGSSRYFYIAGGSPQECGIGFYANGIYPSTATGSVADNSKDLGSSNARWDDVYATNGTIQTSDRNEKQDIEELSEAEQRVAVAAKGLLRKFRWKSAVEEKGEDARIHFGIIAQDLQAAFEAEGLDAGRYAMFIHSEWWETYTDVPAVEAQDAVYETVVIPAEYDEDGNEITPETTEERLVSEAVEAQEAYTRTDTYDTEEEAPEGAVKKSRMGVRYSELLAFIIAAI